MIGLNKNQIEEEWHKKVIKYKLGSLLMTMINLLHIFAQFVAFEIKFCFVYSQEFLKVVRSLQGAITVPVLPRPNVIVTSLMSLVPRLDVSNVTLRMSL